MTIRANAPIAPICYQTVSRLGGMVNRLGAEEKP
jgi:hypothetical protein